MSQKNSLARVILDAIVHQEASESVLIVSVFTKKNLSASIIGAVMVMLLFTFNHSTVALIQIKNGHNAAGSIIMFCSV